MPVKPECRYGHGLLKKIESDQGTAWSIVQMGEKRGMPGTPQEGKFLGYEETGTIYTLDIYRCADCGYMEFFDEQG